MLGRVSVACVLVRLMVRVLVGGWVVVLVRRRATCL